MKHILLFISLLFINSIYSQERINLKLPKIDRKPLGSLTISKGWLLNVDGQWISSQNKIPYPLEKRSSILQTFEKYGLGTDNFIFFELRKIKIADSSYLILIKKYKDGFYKYPSIEKNWINYVSYDYQVFSNKDYSLIHECPSDKINNLDFVNIYYGSIKYLDNTKSYLNNIESDIANSIKEQIESKENHLFIQFIKYSKNGIVRFNINTEDVVTYNNKTLFQKDEVFNHFYFETPTNLFLALFKK